MNTNLVIACWSGNRRVFTKEYDENRSFFIQKQIATLTNLKHNLTQITFVIPDNSNETPEFRSCINNLPLSNAVVLRRPNTGLSYGSFSDAFATYNNFDYYIFIEDDYIFVQDNFDGLMIDIFSKVDNCGYLASYVNKAMPIHPAIFNGLTSKSVLDKLGKLPYPDCNGYVEAERFQADYGQMMQELGYQIHDLSDYYSMPFLNHQGEFVNYGKKDGKYLIVPVQYPLTA